MKPLTVRLLMATAAVVCSLIAAEGMMRIWYTVGQRHELEFTRYSLLFKQDGPDPRLPFEHRPYMAATLMGVTVRTNAAGLRASRAIDTRKTAGTMRMACIGDSLTLGWGVAEAETYCDRLALGFRDRPLSPRFRDVETLNFGVGNYNTVMELEVLRRKALAYQPDVVVIQHYINDAEPVPQYRGNLKPAHSYLAVFLWARLDLLFRQSGLRQDYVQYYRDLYREEQPGLGAMRDAIRGFAEDCRARRIPLIAVIFPELHRLDDGEPFQDVYAAVQRLWETQGVPVVNLWSEFRGREPRTLWVHPADVHPNGTAHALAARAIERAVRAALDRGSEGTK